jgi:hypothetical protein
VRARDILKLITTNQSAGKEPSALDYNFALLAMLKSITYGSEYQYEGGSGGQTALALDNGNRGGCPARGTPVVLFDPVFLKARAGEAAALLLDMSTRGYPVLEAVARLDLSDVYKAFRAHEGNDEAAAAATQLIVQPLVAAMRRLVSSDDQLSTMETKVQGKEKVMTVARDLTVSAAGVRVEASLPSPSTSPSPSPSPLAWLWPSPWPWLLALQLRLRPQHPPD